MNRLPRLVRAALPAMLLAVAGPAAAQATGANTVGGMAAYWYVFVAYAVVIVLVLGWVISIAMRLRDVQDRLGQG